MRFRTVAFAFLALFLALATPALAKLPPGASPPAYELVPPPERSAINDGIVNDTTVPAPETKQVSTRSNASAVWPGVMAPTLVATFSAALVLLLFRRGPALVSQR